MSDKIKLTKEEIANLLMDYETVQRPLETSLKHLCQSVEEILKAIAHVHPSAAVSLIESMHENLPTFQKIADQHEEVRASGYQKLLEKMEE